MSSQVPAQQMQDVQVVTCAACNEQYPLAEIAREDEVRPGLVEVALLCPGCGRRTHAYFDTAELRARRQTVRAALAAWQRTKSLANWSDYQTARSVYNRSFDAVNKRWRRKLGLKKTVREDGE